MAEFGDVEEIDRGFNAIKKELAQIAKDQPVVDVGLLGEKASESHGEATNVMVGSWQEFGTKYIPERSFLRSTFNQKRPEYDAMIAKEAKSVYENKGSVMDGLNRVGLKAANDVKATIRGNIPPPLADSTIARKGSSLPLVDTGQLINGISWVVRPASEGK